MRGVKTMTNQHGTKTALITGATGFVGLHLANRLVSEGWAVHVIVRPQSKVASLQKISQNLTIHYHDGTTKQMITIMNDVRPDVVFHLASFVLSQHEAKDIESLIQSNILFGNQLAEAMTLSRVYCLVNTGTSWQNFQNHEYNPVCLYAATKQAFEAILTYYIEVSPLRVVNLKLFDNYGPYDTRKKLIPLLQETARKQIPLAMSNGEQFIDLVYIDDVVSAYLVAAERLMNNEGSQWEEYAVSSGTPILLKDLVKLYESIIGKNLPIKWGARPYRQREVMVPWSKGKWLPNWEPKIKLEEGLRNLEGCFRA